MMKTSFMAALALSSELALAMNYKFACCEISEVDGDDIGLAGMMLFVQEEGEAMRSMGVVSMDAAFVEPEEDCNKEKRYQGVTENAVEGTCMNQGMLWPFGAEGVEQECALKKLKFRDDGYALHYQKDSPENGHVNNAAMCGSLLCSYSLFSGEKLYVVEDRMNHFAEWAKEERLFGSSRLGFLPFLQLVKCLQEGGSGSKESLLEGEEMDTAEMNAAAEKSPMVSCSLAVCRLELACIFRDLDLAQDLLTDGPDVVAKRPGHFSGCRFTFYEFLASVEIAQKSPSSPLSKRADAAQKQIENWINDGNVNCSHLMPLIKAESAVMKGKKNQARKHFQQVVIEAKSGSYLQDRAMSLERAAAFFLADGDAVAATTYYMRSKGLFKEWGAYSKVRSMNRNPEWSRLIKASHDKSSA